MTNTTHCIGGVDIEARRIRSDLRALYIPLQSAPARVRVSSEPFRSFEEMIGHATYNGRPLSDPQSVQNALVNRIRDYRLMDGLEDPALLYKGSESDFALARSLTEPLTSLHYTDYAAALAYAHAIRTGLFDEHMHLLMQARLYWKSIHVKVVTRRLDGAGGTSEYAAIRVTGEHRNLGHNVYISASVTSDMQVRSGTPLRPQAPAAKLPKAPAKLYKMSSSGSGQARAVSTDAIRETKMDKMGDPVECITYWATYEDGYREQITPEEMRDLRAWLLSWDSIPSAGSPINKPTPPDTPPPRRTLRRARSF